MTISNYQDPRLSTEGPKIPKGVAHRDQDIINTWHYLGQQGSNILHQIERDEKARSQDRFRAALELMLRQALGDEP